MRASWLIGTLGAGTFALCLLLVFAPKRPGTTAPAPPAGAVPEVATEGALPAAAAEAPSPPEPAAGTTTGASTGHLDLATADEKAEAAIAAKIEALRPLAFKTDAASVEKLIFELRAAPPQLWEELLEMVSQSQNRALIPSLQELADETEDPKEKGMLLETVEFLKLPTLTELLQKGQAAPKTQ